VNLELFRRWMPLGVGMLVALALQADLFRRYYRAADPPHRLRRAVLGLVFLLVSAVFLSLGVAAAMNRFAPHFSPVLAPWLHAATLVWILMTIPAYASARLWHAAPVDSSRRRFIRTSLASLTAVPAAAVGYGTFIERSRLQLEEVDLPVPGLPQGLHGLRIAQISDIHLGEFFERRQLDTAVALLNEGKPHLAVVTGDMISRAGDPLEACIESLARLRADAGVFGCLGNHERYARAEKHATLYSRYLGIHYLRQQSVALRFNGALLNLAGVDYQAMRRDRAGYLYKAQRYRNPEAFNLLLSHNPDVFPRAVDLGFPLTLAGHTHGGQVNFEILTSDVNVARFYTPYTTGRYTLPGGVVYVNRGLGTIGIPVRVGAPPEVTLLRLCAA
jgi:hypothetical protein